MPHHKKPRLDDRLDGPAADAVVSVAEDRNTATTAYELSGDVIAIIFGCFPPEDIMRMRRVCKKWREAAKKTIVPMIEVSVESVDKYNAMATMTTALPNLQQITLSKLGWGHKYIDGEDPDEQWDEVTANFATHDINLISNFRKLRVLHIHTAPLNGRYPVLFDFPLLRELRITTSDYLKFDLGMLPAGCPSLKELKLIDNDQLVGNLRSLRVLKDTLEKLEISCQQIEGNFMDLADFPRLKQLNLRHTSVTGDVRDIGGNDFPSSESLILPRSVCGGIRYEFQSISEVPSFMQAIYLLLQRTPTLFGKELPRRAFYWCLSEDSPDWYEYDNTSGCPLPPFYLQIIRAGSRRGWSWYTFYDDHWCEINWLDPEPSSESSGYEAYIEALQFIERCADFYRGYSQPPTLAEYNRLCEEYTG
eukprot:scaffold26504_cov228-Skeletonema_dohrnii-CCMP3373.AAC.3